MQAVSCQRLPQFMKAQLEVVQKHLDEHKYLRKMTDKNAAMESFIADYGWLIREMYCTQTCDLRNVCPIAQKLKANGDLLKDKLPKL